MESIVYNIFFHQWQRKLVALLTAAIIWVFVNYSITSSKTIPFVPIRVINLPPDKTIHGLLPNGFLKKRTSLVVTGTRSVIDQLEPGDVEVILDVSHLPSDGIVQITKKNLISLNPNFNFSKHVTSVDHPEFVINMSPILTEKIPITINRPLGKAPPGYEFLDIWPIHLFQTVSGPQEDVLALKNQELELTFNMDEITKEQLDSLMGSGPYDDEISFYIPDAWKKIEVPFSSRGYEQINDPEAKNLHINFLRKHLLPIKNDLPLHVFYPLKNSASINPITYPLVPSEYIQIQNNLPILTLPLYADNVSKLFLEIVKDNLEVDIVAAPQTEREKLEWGISFVDDAHIENTYTAFLLNNSQNSDLSPLKIAQKEQHYRNRFRLYMQQFTLFLAPEYPLELESRLEDDSVVVHIPNTFILQKEEK